MSKLITLREGYKQLDITRDEMRNTIREALEKNPEYKKFLRQEKLGNKFTKHYISIEFIPILKEIIHQKNNKEIQEDDIKEYLKEYWDLVEKFEYSLKKKGKDTTSNLEKGEENKDPFWLNMELLDSVIVSSSIKKFILFYKANNHITEKEKSRIRDIVYRQMFPKFKKYTKASLFGVREVDKSIDNE